MSVPSHETLVDIAFFCIAMSLAAFMSVGVLWLAIELYRDIRKKK